MHETEMTYPKRLIEVDLPIRRISAHARREKSIRHGHISTLHIWWARRPLAACRAVILAALWPDPADEHCPPPFRAAAKKAMLDWAREHLMRTSAESFPRFHALRSDPARLDDPLELRHALLDFIADFANWDNSTVREYLDTSRALTQAAHEALGGAPGTRPLVVDPFAGGGSIPLEALRVGADAFASDLNPIAVLLNKVVLEYIPRYGQRLAGAVRQWGAWIKQEADKELAAFYPKDPDGATPIAYLWARTIRCEGPGCGAEVPLVRSLWLAKKAGRMKALKLVPNRAQRRVEFAIVTPAQAAEVGPGTVARGAVTCPCCGFTTRVEAVRRQLKEKRGGANDARLLAVVTTRPGRSGRDYRLPTEADLAAVAAARAELARRQAAHRGALSLTPEEPIDIRGIRHTWGMTYGMERWGDLFTARQLLALTTLTRLVVAAGEQLRLQEEAGFAEAVQTGFAFALSRQADYLTSLTVWSDSGEFIAHTFGRQALPIVWDWPECAPFRDGSGNWDGALEWVSLVLEANVVLNHQGHVERCSATTHALPDDAAQAFITDPPYYDAVPYAYLSDFFYVWLKRTLASILPNLFSGQSVPKDDEIVVDRPHRLSQSHKDIAFYERQMTRAFAEGRRLTAPDGIGVIVFASKTTASWEAILQAIIDAGWVITGSWPIDTERETRVAAQGQARLASSIHIVVRPRENPDGSLRTTEVGDWRDLLSELPRRIHEWMPRLAEEGVVGADAIFACLGPALEIFSRYSRVEKASGEVVTLREYLEQVWAAVAKEALAQVFREADASGFEPDARLTAMWLWTLNAGAADGEESPTDAEEADAEEETKGKAARAKGGFVLEYDAARKIAQGLGAHLEEMTRVIEISGDTARLLPVAERSAYLFGKGERASPAASRRRKSVQLDLFGEPKVGAGKTASSRLADDESGMTVSKMGATTLDRVHQAMLLFAAGRGEALKRFLVEEGAGRDARFWRLAQALSALYPASSNEKRWVDGVLARKKGLGL